MNPRWLPPEWAPQEAMLLVWPRTRGDWGTGLDAARDVIADMAAVLARTQRIIIAAADSECVRNITTHPRLTGLPDTRLQIVDVANDDIWARDTGPLTVCRADQRIFVDCRFDGWGGQFDARDDDRLTAALYETGVLGSGSLERHDLVLEGGSIESNGAGALLTTERCLLRGRRNAGLDRSAAEDVLRDTLGGITVHWLAYGELIGDDTDGHIDTLARFVDADTIVYQGCGDTYDDHYESLAAMARQLAELRNEQGAPYRLVALPLPAPIHDPDDGHRLPAGYANFLIANHCVLIPAFDDPADAVARDILTGLFPTREIVPIDSRALIRQHGGMHCAAMQIPGEAK